MAILKKTYSYAYHIHSRLIANDIESYLREKYLNKIAVADSGIWQIDDIDINETGSCRFICRGENNIMFSIASVMAVFDTMDEAKLYQELHDPEDDYVINGENQ